MRVRLLRLWNLQWTEQLMMLASLAWMIRFSRLVIDRHNSFLTFDFDLGIHSQSIWLLSRGKFFNTVCGLPVFGHHAVFMYYFLVPLQWLGGGPNLWNVLQVTALGTSSVLVFKIAHHRLGNNFAALTFGLAWLLIPTTGYLVWETFHPEVMGAPFLLTGYLYAISERDPRQGRIPRGTLALFWMFAAVLWKEDLALAVAGIGFILILRHQHRLGIRIMLGGAAYFLVVGVFLVPMLAGDLSSYGLLYGDLGTTPFGVAENAFRNPSLILDRLSTNNAVGYANQIMAPLAWMPLLAPLTLVIFLPQFFINILTETDFTWSMMYHYQIVPVLGATLAAIDGVRFVQRHNKTVSVLCLVAVLTTSLWTARNWGNSPLGSKFGTVPWDVHGLSTAGWTAAMTRIGPDDGISVQYPMVPHVADREFVYTFPNPWIADNFFNPSRSVNPKRIKWIVVAADSLGEENRRLLTALVSSGEFGNVQTVDGISSYQRLK